jgi:hypothetical protein
MRHFSAILAPLCFGQGTLRSPSSFHDFGSLCSVPIWFAAISHTFPEPTWLLMAMYIVELACSAWFIYVAMKDLRQSPIFCQGVS